MLAHHGVILVLTLLGMGLSAPLIRLARAPALAVVLYRIAFAWPVLAVVAVLRRESWPWRTAVPAGAFLALHWVTWVIAVQNTTIASAALLIWTGTLWSALLSRPLLKESVSGNQWLGLVLGLLGVFLVVATGQSRTGPRRSLFGDGVALVGSVAWVGYSFIGRRARSGQQAGFWSYTTCVYGVAGLVVLGSVLSTRTTMAGYTDNTWLALAGVALLPTLLGHGGLNFLLRHMGPARLSLWTLAEPVIATLVAWPMFGEIPSAQVIVGGVATLLGVALGVSRSTDRHTTQ